MNQQATHDIDSLLRIQQVSKIVNVSVPHLRKAIRLQHFPQPIILLGVKVWKKEAVQSFIDGLGGQA